MDYQNGKIYKLVSDKTDDIYIGSTCSSLTKRLTSHKAPSNGTISKQLFTDDAKVEIILIESYPCKSKDELRARERYYQTTMDCINKNKTSCVKIDFSEGKKEWMKEYRKENKEHIKEQNKNYEEENKDKIKERHKKYREENKDIISEKAKEYNENHKQEAKEYRDNHKDKIKEYNNNYYEEQKDKIKEKTKNYRLNNLDIIKQKQKIKHNCDCGGKYTNSGKSEHIKTTRHKLFLDKQTKP
jgi:hypothetical protein